MTVKTVPFDIVSELESDTAIAEYLSQVFADGDSDEIVRALGQCRPCARHGATGQG